MAEEKSLGKKPMEAALQDETFRNLSTKINELSTVSAVQPFLFKVPPQQRHVNTKAYEPELISIGPYHRGKEHLREMEKLKLCYLGGLLQREQNYKANCLESYIEACASMEEQVRGSYAETVQMSSADFVEMTVLDACFVIELIRQFKFPELREESRDVLFKQNLNLIMVKHDLLLLENQLPLFLLDRLFRITNIPDKEKGSDFARMVVDFFYGVMPWERTDISHPLAPLFRQLIPRTQRTKNEWDSKHLLGIVHNDVRSAVEEVEYLSKRDHGMTWDSIASATELYEVGIRFKKSEQKNLFAVKFERNELLIPRLMINLDTERVFLNHIAYEQFNEGFYTAANPHRNFLGGVSLSANIFMAYGRLMNCLIRDAKDVALLSECGIIYNTLGSDEEAAKLFKKLGDTVFLSMESFYYQNLYDMVNEYCQRSWNLCKVELRRGHFRQPWDWILTSLAGATVLLFLTLLQTIFTVLAYFKAN